MKDPFYRAFDDGTVFTYKTYLGSCVVGLLSTAVVFGGIELWVDRKIIKRNLKRAIKNQREK